MQFIAVVVLIFMLRDRYHITTMSLVPSLVHQIVHHPRFETADLSSIQGISSSAAYLPPHLAAQLCARLPVMKRVSQGVFPSPLWIILLLPTSTGYGLSEFVSDHPLLVTSFNPTI